MFASLCSVALVLFRFEELVLWELRCCEQFWPDFSFEMGGPLANPSFQKEVTRINFAGVLGLTEMWDDVVLKQGRRERLSRMLEYTRLVSTASPLSWNSKQVQRNLEHDLLLSSLRVTEKTYVTYVLSMKHFEIGSFKNFLKWCLSQHDRSNHSP